MIEQLIILCNFADMKTTTQQLTINVLLCDTFPGRLPEDIPSYVTMFERLFQKIAHVHYNVFMAMDGELPQKLNHHELYLIPGCMYSAYDPLPWIEHLQEWIRNAVSQGVFLIGVCFGHQVIAQALGGKVEKYAGGWGAGIRESTIVDQSMLDFFPDGKLQLLYNHHDQVVALPAEAKTLATSVFCRYEACRINDQVYTFQGHPEYTPYYMRYYLDNLAADQDPLVVQQACSSLEKMTPQGVEVAEWVINRFSKWLHTRLAD